MLENKKINAAREIKRKGLLSDEQLLEMIEKNITEGKISTEKGASLKIELFPLVEEVAIVEEIE